MIDHLGKRLARASLLLGLAGLVALPACARAAEPPAGYAVSLGEARDVPAGQPGQPALREFVLEVRKEGDQAPRRLVFSAPEKMIDAGEKPELKVVGQRLLVHTRAVLSVFDLTSGEKAVEIVAAPEVAATADGSKAAFKVLQLPFTPPEATSSIVEVLDVTTLKTEPVFPERSAIETGQLGRLMVWEEDPLKRHAAGALAWSPDGTSLAFLCTHGEIGMADSPHPTYLVVIDLRRGLAGSRFVHQELDWRRYLKPGAKAGGRDLACPAAEVAWGEGDTLVLEPAPSCGFLREKIVIPLPRQEEN